MKADDGNIVQRRPTETITGVAGAIAFLIVYLLDVTDPAVYFAFGVVQIGRAHV